MRSGEEKLFWKLKPFEVLKPDLDPSGSSRIGPDTTSPHEDGIPTVETVTILHWAAGVPLPSAHRSPLLPESRKGELRYQSLTFMSLIKTPFPPKKA